jgi:carbonic anhydrase
MFQVGEQPDPALEVIKKNFIQGNDTVPFPSINATLSFSHLLTNSEPFDYYFYQGSSTIPPCFVGGLNWVIPKRVYSMSQAQRDFFWQLFNDQGSRVGNWRALQPLNDNPVYLKQQ